MSVRAIDENYWEFDGCSGNGAYTVPTCENGVRGIGGVSTIMRKRINPLKYSVHKITILT